jgi:hypothetical protein
LASGAEEETVSETGCCICGTCGLSLSETPENKKEAPPVGVSGAASEGPASPSPAPNTVKIIHKRFKKKSVFYSEMKDTYQVVQVYHGHDPLPSLFQLLGLDHP